MKLSIAIGQYRDFKLALGAKFETEDRQLRFFLKGIGDVCLNDITEAEVQKYLLGQRLVTSTYLLKNTILNGLFKFAIARGYCNRSPLPRSLPKESSNFSPYIYSVDDLRRLLATNEKITRKELIEPDTFRVLILLLYGATLRISEALFLDINDIDLDQGLLTIRESKFYKTRIVPMGTELRAALVTYWRSRHKKGAVGKFLLGRRKEELKRGTVEQKYRRLRKIAGVLRKDGPQPRLHDLRHTGAVHRIIAWYKSGKDVQKLLPPLSVFMGHKSLRETQVYLTVTPEIMGSASERFSQYAFAAVSP
jgi:integrase/recombinase XerD